MVALGGSLGVVVLLLLGAVGGSFLLPLDGLG